MTFGWMVDAACADKTWMTFKDREDEARQVCLDCPVSTPCLDFARSEAARGIPGVLAGLTADERGQVECDECGTLDWKMNTRDGLCWRCYKDARRKAAA